MPHLVDANGSFNFLSSLFKMSRHALFSCRKSMGSNYFLSFSAGAITQLTTTKEPFQRIVTLACCRTIIKPNLPLFLHQNKMPRLVNQQQQQQKKAGTMAHDYKPTRRFDGINSSIVLQAITAMPQFEDKSF